MQTTLSIPCILYGKNLQDRTHIACALANIGKCNQIPWETIAEYSDLLTHCYHIGENRGISVEELKDAYRQTPIPSYCKDHAKSMESLKGCTELYMEYHTALPCMVCLFGNSDNEKCREKETAILTALSAKRLQPSDIVKLGSPSELFLSWTAIPLKEVSGSCPVVRLHYHLYHALIYLLSQDDAPLTAYEIASFFNQINFPVLQKYAALYSQNPVDLAESFYEKICTVFDVPCTKTQDTLLSVLHPSENKNAAPYPKLPEHGSITVLNYFNVSSFEVYANASKVFAIEAVVFHDACGLLISFPKKSPCFFSSNPYIIHGCVSALVHGDSCMVTANLSGVLHFLNLHHVTIKCRIGALDLAIPIAAERKTPSVTYEKIPEYFYRYYPDADPADIGETDIFLRYYFDLWNSVGNALSEKQWRKLHFWTDFEQALVFSYSVSPQNVILPFFQKITYDQYVFHFQDETALSIRFSLNYDAKSYYFLYCFVCVALLRNGHITNFRTKVWNITDEYLQLSFDQKTKDQFIHTVQNAFIAVYASLYHKNCPELTVTIH